MHTLVCFVVSLVVCGALCDESPKNGRVKRNTFGGDRFGGNWGVDGRISPDMGRVYYPGTPGGPQKLGWEESRSSANGWFSEQMMQGSYKGPQGRSAQEYGHYPQSWYYNPPQQSYGYNYQMQPYSGVYSAQPYSGMYSAQPYSGMYSAWNSPHSQNILRQEIPQASQQWYPGGGQQYWGSYQSQPPRQNWYPPTRQW